MHALTLSTLAAALFASATFAHTDCKSVDASVIKHTGISTGVEEKHDGIRLYIAKPDNSSIRAKENPTSAIVYLTDVFGIELVENRLLADSFARAGYLTIAPDLFNNEHASGDINVPGFNTSAFLARHGPDVTDPIIASTINHLRTAYGIKKIGLTGYCFGGRYSFRFLGAGKGGDAGYAAHPSLLENGEIEAIKGPAAIGAAETDGMMSPARRSEIEALLAKGSAPWQVNLYSGTNHGFGVRANISDPEQLAGKEEAFLQAVRWFDRHLSRPDFILRPAVDEDRDACYTIHRVAMYDVVKATFGWDEEDQIARWNSEWDPSEFQIVVVDGRMIGSIDVVDRTNDILLSGIELEPAFQGRGIGSALIGKLQAKAAQRGVPLVLGVFEANPRARALYERLGFKEFHREGIKALMRWEPDVVKKG
ncbi:acyl-CoA N-acyltransferase [Cercophora newfieldiana]|uniref:Acyl-CoA N-acyltransferase n=1 Tax=Cercophora newfieldiana TaxID=92897 RepID=A0AA39Y4I3_9PEZI|nr:acyl-CoA N-acyltransferase [Cercophora newfieldiana]